MITRAAALAALGSLAAGCAAISDVQATQTVTSVSTVDQGGPTTPVPAAAQTTAAAPTQNAGSNNGSGGNGYATALVPASAWIAPTRIPLYSSYRWNAPAAVAKQGANPHQFSLSVDCQSRLNNDDQATVNEFQAATAEIQPTAGGSGGDNDWLAQEQIIAAPDFTSGSIQSLSAVFTDLVGQANSCGATAHGAHVAVGTSTGSAFSATLTIPTSTGATLTVHEYLAMPYGYLVEFTEWVAPYAGNNPTVGWSGASDAAVLAALQTGPCAVSKEC